MMLAENQMSPDARGAEAQDVGRVEASLTAACAKSPEELQVAWQAAVHRLTLAGDAVARFTQQFLYPAEQSGKAPQWMEDEYERIVAEFSAAQTWVMNCPSPDLGALRLKLEYALEDDGTESTAAWSIEYLTQMMADIARLMPRTVGRSPLDFPA